MWEMTTNAILISKKNSPLSLFMFDNENIYEIF